jgi:hypothetical protein
LPRQQRQQDCSAVTHGRWETMHMNISLSLFGTVAGQCKAEAVEEEGACTFQLVPTAHCPLSTASRGHAVAMPHQQPPHAQTHPCAHCEARKTHNAARTDGKHDVGDPAARG